MNISHRHIRPRKGPLFVAALALILPILIAAPQANALSGGALQGETIAAPAYAVPVGLKSTGQTDQSISLAWVASANVPRYRVQVYSKADMSDSVFYRFTDPAAEIRGLVKSTAYQFRIRGISADGSVNLTGYSAPITVTTAAAPAFAVPAGLKSTGQTDQSISLVWVASANVPRYRIQVYSKADMSDSVFYRFETPSAVIAGLVKSTAYQFRIRGISADGSVNLTGYSAPITVTTAAAPAFAVPSGLNTSVTSHSSISVSWNPVANAPGYRVQVYSKSDMSDSGFTRFTGASGTITGLKPETVYFARVRVIGAAGENLSGYSPAVSFTTPVDPYPTPSEFTATATYRTANLSWNAVPNAPQYRVAVATRPDMSDATWHRYAGVASAEMRGLSPLSTYYFQVRVIDEAGDALSSYTPVLAVTTKAEPPAPPELVNPLTVASYNIMCANCVAEDEDNPNALPWADRRGAVVDTIKSKMPDIVGIQEASQAWLNEPGYKGGISQFEDLLQRLNTAGAHYAPTNDKRNNCVNSTTPTECVYADQGASQGTRIFYNPDTVEILRSGSKALPMGSISENQRYLAWAVAKQKNTGKLFFFADTHLLSGQADGYYELRKQQADAIVDIIKNENTDALPVLMTGDLNSSKWREPSNAPYDAFTAAGLIDPLGNDYLQEFPSMAATAEHRIHTDLNSWNGLEYTPRANQNPAANGTYIDYIFTSKMRVGEWETVANLDAAGNYVGTFPSDHNMIVAKVGLP
ncbi:fibronectin type III domain-containing protein [Paenarthrobacter sp. PH39-S1]|uniref:fibronectin type III domain-containing protein n=1 Tax=Paenarthrobacter sp. PH39-S1 TaxID=3046204 RepID=UPI0024B97FDC|nr:fibronectin type III domain-containing protein [Paenarthrobacter sp. PH39-S1]MDJ0356568.1 fibronectin type III domain-containing protein [Paenarthrobacter sp. PH39-S1]